MKKKSVTLDPKKELISLNNYLDETSSKKNFSRNYIHFFRPNAINPINIVGSFKQAIDCELNTYNCVIPNFTANSKMSFGMIASEDFSHYKDLLLGDDSPFKSKKNFEKYVDNHSCNFCIDKGELVARNSLYTYDFNQYQKAFFARCIITNSWSFKVNFTCDNNDFLEDLSKDKNCNYTVENGKHYIYGRISEHLIESWSNVKLYIYNNDKPEKKEVSLIDLYKTDNIDYFKCYSNALYSGVIPRLLNVEYFSPSMANNDIYKIQFNLGRTSFMTIYAFNHKNNKEILNHPFLSIKENGATLKDVIIQFDKKEVEIQKVYYQDIKQANHDEQKELLALNKYLNKSWNIHNVNVSGNLYDIDDKCIYTKRSINVTDSSCLYCSVNGASEIHDSDVIFYNNSVQEDIPTINYSDTPFYFGGELTRESIAELAISDISPYWNYYGFTCMSYYKENTDHALWLHFNILGEKKISDSFNNINENRKQASERFENESIYAYTLSINKTIIESFTTRFRHISRILIDNKDIITTFILVLIIIFNKKDLSLDMTLSIIFALLLGILLVSQIRSYYKSLTTIKRISAKIYKTNFYNSVFKKLKPKKNSDIDLILYVLTRLRIIYKN